jgi:hypothetical protein
MVVDGDGGVAKCQRQSTDSQGVQTPAVHFVPVLAVTHCEAVVQARHTRVAELHSLEPQSR